MTTADEPKVRKEIEKDEVRGIKVIQAPNLLIAEEAEEAKNNRTIVISERGIFVAGKYPPYIANKWQVIAGVLTCNKL